VNFTDCADAQFEHNELRSVEGSPILYKEYTAVDGRKPQARILLIGGIHGDEYTSVSVVFQWVRKLNEYHSGMFEWRVVPLLNPDGLLKSQSQRTNANGVDLNRNFPTPNWDELSQRHWVKDTGRNPRRYPGAAPVSEPESKWLVDTIAKFKPDAIVSLHAPYGVLDFDGPRTSAPQRLGDLRLQLLGTYPGSLGNYAGVNNGIPVVTIELPNAGTMPKAEQVSRLWIDLVTWLKNNIAPLETQKVTAADQAGPS
ncbi:MAG: M14 family murein peptide amidase A, partial [Gammaproteobacteria bacterium]|nr:M14 family murein peptide amidase A [Gammaproteobacteria bacterium]